MLIRGARKPMNGSRSDKRGFSLLEIIVSMVIILTLAAGIFATVSFAKRVSIQAQQKQMVVSFIESRLAELKSKGASNLDPAVDVDDPSIFKTLGQVSAKCAGNGMHDRKSNPSDIYCESISEFGDRMKGMVMATISCPELLAGMTCDKAVEYKSVYVLARWIDFTVSPNRVRSEDAVTIVFKG